MPLINTSHVPDIRPIGANGTFIVADNTVSKGFRWIQLTNSYINQPPFPYALTISPTSVLVGGSLIDPTFTVSSWGTTPTGIYVEGPFTQEVTGTPTTFNYSGTITNNTHGATQSFTVSAYNAYGSGYETKTVYWLQYQFWGAATGAATYNSGFIRGLSNSGLNLTHSRTIVVTGSAGQYIWYAAREGLGLSPTFKDNTTDIKGGVSLFATGIPFINSNGITENYQLWRSDNVNLGPMSITIE